MTDFTAIEARAAELCWLKLPDDAAAKIDGRQALENRLSRPLPPSELLAKPDDRWLSEMAHCIFQAGFNWDLIDARWPQFEAAFFGFDIARWVFMSDDDLDALLKAPGLVANAQKIQSVGQNARFVAELAGSHGSAGAWFQSWPLPRYMELCAELKTRGARLGGATGQRVMRRMGLDAFIFTPTVIKALNALGVIEGEPTSKKAQAAVQDRLNSWHAQSGRGLTQMSQILAFATD